MKNLTIKELFVALLPLSMFVSTFFMIRVLGNAFGEPTEIFYMNRLSFIVISVLTAVMAYAILTVMKKIYTNTKQVYVGTAILTALFIYFNSTFIHPVGVGIFFLELYIPSLFINGVFAFLLSIVVYKIMRPKV